MEAKTKQADGMQGASGIRTIRGDKTRAWRTGEATMNQFAVRGTARASWQWCKIGIVFNKMVNTHPVSQTEIRICKAEPAEGRATNLPPCPSAAFWPPIIPPDQPRACLII